MCAVWLLIFFSSKSLDTEQKLRLGEPNYGELMTGILDSANVRSTLVFGKEKRLLCGGGECNFLLLSAFERIDVSRGSLEKTSFQVHNALLISDLARWKKGDASDRRLSACWGLAWDREMIVQKSDRSCEAKLGRFGKWGMIFAQMAARRRNLVADSGATTIPVQARQQIVLVEDLKSSTRQ